MYSVQLMNIGSNNTFSNYLNLFPSFRLEVLLALDNAHKMTVKVYCYGQPFSHLIRIY